MGEGRGGRAVKEKGGDGRVSDPDQVRSGVLP